MLLPPVTPGPYREMENIPVSGVFGEHPFQQKPPLKGVCGPTGT